MSPEELDHWVRVLGWTPEQVLDVYVYESHGEY